MDGTLPAVRPLSRRGLLSVLGAAGGGGLLALVGRRTGALSSTPALRPPGAESEAGFLAACIRCGQCVEACPVEALHLGGLAGGVASGSPFVDARAAPCTLCQGHDELLCIAACPTTALHPVGDPFEVRMGVAVIDTERCLAWNDTVCRSCWHACPFPDRAIVLGARTRPEIVDGACVGCGLCDHACLTEPSSIAIVPFGRRVLP